MKRYTHVFFDLDHTLWDYDTNARATLSTLFDRFELSRFYSDQEAFFKSFHYHNDRLWYRYNHGEINREHIRDNRFISILEDRGIIHGKLAGEMSAYYMAEGPKKTGLLPNAREALEYLVQNYQLGILSNGFDDIQSEKLTGSGIHHYFKWVITSETTGHRKPSTEIFEHALQVAGVVKSEVLMIGDNYSADIEGAMNSGWDAIWFNPNGIQENTTCRAIKNLKELTELL